MKVSKILNVRSEATLSDEKPEPLYRFSLTREWQVKDWLGNGGGYAGDALKGRVCFIMLNPSTADATLDDPTIRRCRGFAQAWGYTSIEVVNLFSFRATNPGELAAVASPDGPTPDGAMGVGRYKNLQAILMACSRAQLIVCAWGTDGALFNRGAQIREALKAHGFQAHHLGLTKGGFPRHPLYLRSDVTPEPWL